MKNYCPIVLSALFAAFMLFVRLTAYEPLGKSISTYDTNAFIAAGHIPFPSPEFFISDRPATIGLFYKLLEPDGGYQVTALSSPAEDIYLSPAIQPGLERVALAQGLLSISAWILLAFVVARKLENSGLQIVAVLLILAFGFSPTIAEWDSVLLSEPISLFLFVILLAISIELVPRLTNPILDSWTIFLIVAWSLVLLLWVFARDTNAYMLLVLVAALLLLLILRWRLKNPGFLSKRNISIFILAMSLLFLIQSNTLQKSGRWINPFFNNILHNVIPYPDRVAFFETKGMPINDAVLALRNSPGNEDAFFEIPELMSWTTEHGTGTYIQFLLAFPGWTFEKFIQGVEVSFSENRQPFFVPNQERTTPALAYVGDLLHPRSSSVIWVVLVELVAFGFLAVRSNRPVAISLFVLFTVLFIGEMLMLFVSIHGDALGIVRHALGSVMPFRLSIWLLPLFILDLYAVPATLPQRKAVVKRIKK